VGCRWRLTACLLGGLLMASLLAQPTINPEKKVLLAVAIDYSAERFAEQLHQLKGLGITQVVVRLTALPSPNRWQAMLDALAKSELEWRLWLANLPRTSGWVVLPERYRLRGNEQGVYTLQISGATETLLALSPRDQPSLQGLSRLTLSGGRAVAAVGNSGESLLLLYPRLENALPDLWEGWDRYRDALIALLLTRPPDERFRGWLIESGWEAQSAAALPESRRFAAEWQGFLQRRYGELTELERAWDTATPLARFDQATRLIPLWHGERGLPLLVSLDAQQKPIEVVPRHCRFWDDYHTFLGERWRIMLSGLRQTLLTFTPGAEFAVIQPMPDLTDLPVPDTLSDPALPTAVYLPARWRNAWRHFLIQKGAISVVFEWANESTERASLIQELAREVGAVSVIWHLRGGGTLPRETWQALQAVDASFTRSGKPTILHFPASLWAVTRIQKWRAGWWVPMEASSDLQPLFWGFELFAFWRPVEIQEQDREGKSVAVQRIELYLWLNEGEREMTLRRFDQKSLSALNLNGETVPLTVRGNTVRLKVGTVPVRLRGFETLPLCESVVNDWTQRVDSLLKRNTTASQDTRALRFLFDSALSTYRRDPVQGFALLRDAWLEAERAFQPYRLFEAESSRDHTFGTVRRDLGASGGATLWLHTPLPPSTEGFYARYPLNIRTEGVYNLYLACRVRLDSSDRSDRGEIIEWQLFSSTDEKAPVAKGSAPLDASRAVSSYADRFIWLPLGNTTLKAGDYLLQLRYLPANGQSSFYAEWDMVLVAPPGITPRGAMPPAY